MPISIVCQSTLLRDLLISSFQVKGHEVHEACETVDDLMPFEDGDMILIHAAENCDFVPPAVSFLRSSGTPIKIVVLCSDVSIDCLRRDLGTSVEAIIPDTLHIDSLTVTLTMVENGYKVVHFDQLMREQNTDPVGIEERSSPNLMPSHGDNLSRQEATVLASLQRGLPNKLIGKNLGISEATVKVHLRAIYRKMGVQNRTQAALWGTRQKENTKVV